MVIYSMIVQQCIKINNEFIEPPNFWNMNALIAFYRICIINIIFSLLLSALYCALKGIEGLIHNITLKKRLVMIDIGFTISSQYLLL